MKLVREDALETEVLFDRSWRRNLGAFEACGDVAGLFGKSCCFLVSGGEDTSGVQNLRCPREVHATVKQACVSCGGGCVVVATVGVVV